MLEKTTGIVFKNFKYSDTSIIVKVFTLDFGTQTYIVNGVRNQGKKAKNKIALFQPLTLLDMVVYYKEGKDINRIAEVRCKAPFQQIPFDIKKAAIAMFIAEILYKTVREEKEVQELFHFIYHSIEMLDHLSSGYESFHLQFLLKLAKYLGFAVESSVEHFPEVDEEKLKTLNDLIFNSYEKAPAMANSMRRILLDYIIDYYKVHIDSVKEINSLKILQEVL